ncbi:MAG TPA: polyprenyl diphosphate synthase [Gammaproteobacteria bacterium]|nr:polyprenyl diphosphate synthase [Gammaproteobacteria bacterium]
MVAKSIPQPGLPAPPRHVAIIMDGNGRWAERRGKPRIAGHQGGIEPVREVVKASAELGIEALTLFAFSSENFDRPADEVSALMALFLEALDSEIAELDANGVRLRFIGDGPLLGPGLGAATRAAEARTAANSGLLLVIAAAYGGRWDVTQAARRLAELARDGRLDPAAIDEATFGRALATAELPPVDLLIRTGGEQRISNFLLWQLAYSELYFSECLWPEFDRAELVRALEFFARRERRFGRTSRQLGTGAC